MRHDPAYSEQMIRQFAQGADISYEEILEYAKEWLEFGKWQCQGGKWEGFYLPDEFWDHYEAVMGKRVADNDRGSFFSCSC